MIKLDVIKRVLVLSVFTLVFGFSFVQAVEYGGIGGRPAYPREDNPRTESIFIHILNPGDSQKEGIRIVNNSAEEKTMLVYGVDSTPSTDGAFACKQLSQEKIGVGSWIKLDKTEISLKPSTNEIIPFTINIPKSAGVGEHNGCLIIQEKIEKLDDQGGVSLSFRTGLRVAITIPGELERKLEMKGFTVTSKKDGGYIIEPKVKNLGNVSIDADVSVTTRYFFGLIYAENGGQYPILRNETSSWNFEIKKPFWGGWYRSAFTVDYDKNAEASVGVKSGKKSTRLSGENVWFFSSPAPLALAIEIIIILLIISLLIVLDKTNKKNKWIKKNWVSYEVKQGDDIKSLADKFNVSWKLLIKINRLNAPYTLLSGDNIQVPPFK
jgi:LysM repeat protein